MIRRLAFVFAFALFVAGRPTLAQQDQDPPPAPPGETDLSPEQEIEPGVEAPAEQEADGPDADAETGEPDAEPARKPRPGRTLSDSPEDPKETLTFIQSQRLQPSLLGVSPLGKFREKTDNWKDEVHEKIGLDFGLSFTTLFQGLTDSVDGADQFGASSDLDFITSLELVDRGKPTVGLLYFHLEGRWAYTSVSPEDLAGESLGSITGTADTYEEYQPVFIPRNLYWQQGSKEAGWAYRIGKVSLDAVVATSQHLSPTTAFLSAVSYGPFSVGTSDSGPGMAGVVYFGEQKQYRLLGAIGDSNAEREDMDGLTGDFFKAVEFGAQLFPITDKAGYSKIAFWHNDGTEDGVVRNGSTGNTGWGFFIKLEQELSKDGNAVGIIRYGRSFDDAALYQEQAGLSFLLYDAFGMQNDVWGVAFNYVDASPAGGVRDEYTLETFYRFPIVPLVDVTVAYQAIWDPAFDLGVDSVSVFSLRIRTTF